MKKYSTQFLVHCIYLFSYANFICSNVLFEELKKERHYETILKNPQLLNLYISSLGQFNIQDPKLFNKVLQQINDEHFILDKKHFLNIAFYMSLTQYKDNLELWHNFTDMVVTNYLQKFNFHDNNMFLDTLLNLCTIDRHFMNVLKKINLQRGKNVSFESIYLIFII